MAKIYSPTTKVSYGNKVWTVGAILWLGERYYMLVRGREVALIPADALKLEDKEAVG